MIIKHKKLNRQNQKRILTATGAEYASIYYFSYSSDSWAAAYSRAMFSFAIFAISAVN